MGDIRETHFPFGSEVAYSLFSAAALKSDSKVFSVEVELLLYIYETPCLLHQAVMYYGLALYIAALLNSLRYYIMGLVSYYLLVTHHCITN